MESQTMLVDSVTQVVVPPGGATMTVTMKVNSKEVRLTFPYEQIPGLLEVAVYGRTECKRQQGKAPNDDADLLVTKGFEFGQHSASGLPVLMLALANGGRLYWAFERGMHIKLFETIGTFIGYLNPSKPPNVRVN